MWCPFLLQMRNSRQKFREITRFASPVSLIRAVHCMFYNVWSLLHIFPNFLIVFDIKIDSIPNTLFFAKTEVLQVFLSTVRFSL